MIKLKDILKENSFHEGEPIVYKGRNYFVGPTKGFKQVFVFHDKKLSDIVKINGKTLMVRVGDIDYKLKEDKKDGTYIRVKSIKNRIATGEDGSKWKILTTRPNVMKGDFALDTDINVINWHKDYKDDSLDMDIRPYRKVVKLK